MSERKALMARAKDLGLPARGTNAELKQAISEKEASPGGTPSDGVDLVAAVVLEQLSHNGKDYGAGEPVELTQKQFERLQHLGVVAAAKGD